MGTRIIAIGNALMDIFAFVDPALPASEGFEPHTVSHVSSESLDRLLLRLEAPIYSAGGGSANTAHAARLLGAESRFFGVVGDDELGRRYEGELKAAGVECSLSRDSLPTGVFCSLIHETGRRSLVVAPGAAPKIRGARIDFARRGGDILYLDGFALGGGELLEDQGRRARESGMLIALDLGSRALVEHRRDLLLDLIPRYCDIVFANEDEFTSLAQGSIEAGCETFGASSCAFVVKRGERGAVYCQGGQSVESPVRALRPLDETGAGDAFAAAFLVARAEGWAPERCLRLGNRVAEETLAVLGLNIDPARIESARAGAGL